LDYNQSVDSWRVQAGSMIVKIKSGFLKKIHPANQPHRKPEGVNYAPFDDTPLQISLLGMTVEEALEAVEKYLDRASLANLETVYLLHGKGTGALRRAIGEYLKTNRLVKESRLGYYNEGGAGVTVVTLRRV